MTTAMHNTSLRRLFSADEGAAILEVPESRFRSSWRASGIVTALSTIDGKGAMYAVASLVRAALYLQVQEWLGSQSDVAVKIAKNIPEHALHTLLLDSTAPVIEVVQNGRSYGIEFDATPFERTGRPLEARVLSMKGGSPTEAVHASGVEHLRGGRDAVWVSGTSPRATWAKRGK